MHFCAAKFFGGRFLTDGGLHERRTGEKQSGTFGHQNVIAHHRQIGTTGDAHTHDCSDLRNAHCGHHGVIAKHTSKVVGVREDIFLQRQKDSC